MRNFDKIFRFFALVLFAYSMFISGFSFADSNEQAGILNLILAALWLAVLLAEWVARGQELKWLRRLERVTDKFFRDLIDLVESEGKAKVTVTKKKSATQGKGKIKGAAPAEKPAAKKEVK